MIFYLIKLQEIEEVPPKHRNFFRSLQFAHHAHHESSSAKSWVAKILAYNEYL